MGKAFDSFNLRKQRSLIRRAERESAEIEKRVTPESTLKRLLTAGGTTRVFRWLTEGPFAIVSAGRPEKDAGQKVRDRSELKSRIVQDGYGFYPAQGFYKGVPENSFLVPGLPLEKALEYGRMFYPPQETVMWGKDGEYAFYAISDGEPGPKRSVKEDFAILREPELREMTEKGKDVGVTKVRQDPRTWTMDPRIREWRAEGPKKGSRYVFVSDPRMINAMGNFEKTVEAVSVAKDKIRYLEGGSEFGMPLGVLLVVLPESMLL